MSDSNPACDRLDSSKLYEICVVITFETNNGNSNEAHISNEKHFYYHPNTQKRFVYIILGELERLT
jgi:hypothetical protein